jgi:sugar lactone lactonase YvrE
MELQITHLSKKLRDSAVSSTFHQPCDILEKAKRLSLCYRFKFIKAMPLTGDVIRMAIAKSGKTYLCSMGSKEKNRLDGQIYSIGGKSGMEQVLSSLCFPKALSLSSDDKKLYFAETGSPHILVLDLRTRKIRKFNKQAGTNGIYSIKVTNDHLYTVDRDNNRLTIYDKLGNCIRSLDTTANWKYPMDVTPLDGEHALITFQLARYKKESLAVGNQANLALWNITKDELSPVRRLSLDVHDPTVCCTCTDSMNNIYVTSFSKIWKLKPDFETMYCIDFEDYAARGEPKGDLSVKTGEGILLFDIKYRAGRLFVMERRVFKSIFVFGVA